LPSEREKMGYTSEDQGPRVGVIKVGRKAPWVILTRSGDRRILIPMSFIGNEALVWSYMGNAHEDYWRHSARSEVSLVSWLDGSRRTVVSALVFDHSTPNFAPTGRYVVWYDPAKGGYYSFNVETGKIVNISKGVPVHLYNPDPIGDFPHSCGIDGWAERGAAVLVNDGYDIWRLDLSGATAPDCITLGVGRTQKMCFSVLKTTDDLGTAYEAKDNERILYSTWNEITGAMGVYAAVPDKKERPQKLMEGPYLYSPPVRAKSAKAYLIRLEGADFAPNLYTTNDFLHVKAVTQFKPQSQFNWYRTQIIRWKLCDGEDGVGVLYKPENFDPRKKYPVIFSLYEGDFGLQNEFLTPEASSGSINIPWFVSRGYVVCDPVFRYKVGDPGVSAYETVISCARHLASFRWIDSARMGLQGHSWGGYEVNYIVTRTNLFKAAVSASGLSDLPSSTYNLHYQTGESDQYVSETGQVRMGFPVWRNPEAYIRNSPLFHADKVSTPILIMSNQNDNKVPWTQGIEWFTALRRLERSAWMIDYRGEGHAVESPENQKDFTMRMLSFFDHYLKGAAEPEWMKYSLK
ncbi:MAG: S9 family peptidase, partial [Bacteroidota bacterium]|nr:S9 family peptidase [Bacteroidota bacterium]